MSNKFDQKVRTPAKAEKVGMKGIGMTFAAVAALTILPLAAVTALTPGILIPLCKMPMMQCHTLMHPAAIVISCLIAVTALVNVLVNLRKKEKPNENN